MLYSCQVVFTVNIFTFRDNVTLVTNGIDCLTENGIKTKDGNTYPVDTIIYATGFYPEKSFQTFETVGRNNKGKGKTSDATQNNRITLQEEWTDTPNAYLGMYSLMHIGCQIDPAEARTKVNGHSTLEPSAD